MSTQNLSKLKFRLVSCSSQDPQHPISDLVNNLSETEGWQSLRFCDYPQEITLQFLSPVIIRQMQFLSHQYKIASKIEIFTYLPELWDPVSNNNIKFKKLGYLNLDKNETSNYKARELKSIFLEAPCSYLKLIFHKNHSNKFNVFNQIGLVQLGVFGEFFTRESEKKRNAEALNTINENRMNQLDETTQDRIKTLMNAKDLAIKNEDYEKAKKIKVAIDQLRLIGTHLNQLESQKNMAVASEDYDTAKIITSEILKLRNAISPESLLGNNMKSEKNILPPVKNPTKNSFAEIKGQAEVNRSEQEIIAEIEPIKKVEENEIPEMIQNNEDNSEKNNNTILDKNELSSLDKQSYFKLSYDEQVIPALLKNKKSEALLENEQQPKAEDLKPEKLSTKNQKLAEPLKICIPEEILEKIFSKRWQFKEEGLAWVEKEISQLSNKREDFLNYYVCFFGVVNYTLKDKISQLVLKSLKVLSSLLNMHNIKVTGKSEMMMYQDNILTYVMEKISDNNKKVAETSESMFLELCKSPVFGLQLSINTLIKAFDQKNKTQLPKFLVIRLKLLQKLIGIYKTSPELNFNLVSDFVIRNLDHSSLEVRNAAQEVTKTLIKVFGEEKMVPLLLAWNQNYEEVLRLGKGKNEKGKKNEGANLKNEEGSRNTKTINELTKKTETINKTENGNTKEIGKKGDGGKKNGNSENNRKK